MAWKRFCVKISKIEDVEVRRNKPFYKIRITQSEVGFTKAFQNYMYYAQLIIWLRI